METPFDYFFGDRTNPRTIEVLRGGPLASPLEAYARRLHEDGYATHSGFVQPRLLGCFNSWLHRKGLTSEDVVLRTMPSRKTYYAPAASVIPGFRCMSQDLLGIVRNSA
jgi:hypothetical protein